MAVSANLSGNSGAAPTRRPAPSLAQRLRARWSQMSLRWHVALMVLLTTLAAPAFGALLRWLGVRHMGWRFVLVVLASYGVFLLLVRFWIWLVTPSRGERFNAGDTIDSVDIGTDVAGMFRHAGTESPGSVADFGGGLGDLAGGLSSEGAPILLVVMIVGAIGLCVVGAGVYLVWVGPELLVDAALASLVAAGLVRRSELGAGADDHWLTVIFARTWWVVVVAALVAAVLGGYLESTQPETQTLIQGIHHLMAPR